MLPTPIPVKANPVARGLCDAIPGHFREPMIVIKAGNKYMTHIPQVDPVQRKKSSLRLVLD